MDPPIEAFLQRTRPCGGGTCVRQRGRRRGCGHDRRGPRLRLQGALCRQTARPCPLDHLRWSIWNQTLLESPMTTALPPACTTSRPAQRTRIEIAAWKASRTAAFARVARDVGARNERRLLPDDATSQCDLDAGHAGGGGRQPRGHQNDVCMAPQGTGGGRKPGRVAVPISRTGNRRAGRPVSCGGARQGTYGPRGRDGHRRGRFRASPLRRRSSLAVSRAGAVSRRDRRRGNVRD